MEAVAKFLIGSDDTVKKPNVLFLVHVNLMVYAMCFWMQQPVLPFLSKELGADGMAFGFLQSTVSAFSLIGGPIFGRLTDQYGAKISMILAQASSCVMYLLTSVSFSLPILYASRIPAIGQHAMLCSQAAITLVASSENKAAAMGRLSLSYGIGMVFGGPLGGYLSEAFGMRSAAFIAAVCSATMILIILVLFKENEDRSKSTADSKKEGLNLGLIRILLSNRILFDVLITNFFFALGTSAFATAFSLAAMSEYGFTSQVLGNYISFNAVVAMIGNVFYVPNLISYFNSDYLNIFLFTVIASSCSYIGLLSAYDFYTICLVTIPLTLSNSVMYILGTSLISNAVDSTQQGTAISLSHASRSLVGLVSPVVGGFVYENYTLNGVCIVVLAFLFTSAIYSQIFGRNSYILASREKPKDKPGT